ncbi:hypothetical protein [Acetobacter persici]|uniref:hypothetical protein n=1 Tax=Acetobacter persici TaxID=1076596 RepID=UPI0039EA10B0
MRQSLDELITAHNSLFQQTGEDTRLFWAKSAALEKDIETLLEEVASLKHSVSSQYRQIGELDTKAKGISERISDIEARQKDSEADIKRLQRDFSSYQIGCGKTIIEMQMRLNRLESGKG